MYYRHGDLILEKVESIPKNLKKKEDRILLEGESSGHLHQLDKGSVYMSPEEFLLGFIELAEKALLTHPEHKTIELEPGYYKFYRQREYDEQEDRAVID